MKPCIEQRMHRADYHGRRNKIGNVNSYRCFRISKSLSNSICMPIDNGVPYQISDISIIGAVDGDFGILLHHKGIFRGNPVTSVSKTIFWQGGFHLFTAHARLRRKAEGCCDEDSGE